MKLTLHFQPTNFCWIMLLKEQIVSIQIASTTWVKWRYFLQFDQLQNCEIAFQIQYRFVCACKFALQHFEKNYIK